MRISSSSYEWLRLTVESMMIVLVGGTGVYDVGSNRRQEV